MSTYLDGLERNRYGSFSEESLSSETLTSEGSSDDNELRRPPSSSCARQIDNPRSNSTTLTRVLSGPGTAVMLAFGIVATLLVLRTNFGSMLSSPSVESVSFFRSSGESGSKSFSSTIASGSGQGVRTTSPSAKPTSDHKLPTQSSKSAMGIVGGNAPSPTAMNSDSVPTIGSPSTPTVSYPTISVPTVVSNK